MYNDFGQGGYLLYKLDKANALDNMNIFIYGLGDVFSNNILIDTTKLYKLQEDPEKLISKYNFDLMLTVSRSPLCRYLIQNPNWKVLYSDDMNYVFIKNT